MTYISNGLLGLPGIAVYTVVTALVFGEAALFIGFVLPGETSVILGGFIASQGKVNIAVLIALVVAAAIVGDSCGYLVGQRYGTKLLSLRVLHRRQATIDRALDGLERRGPAYVFLGRFTAFFRAVVPGLAGMSRLSYRRFLAANVLGGICWGVAYPLLGYFAGDAYKGIERDSGYAAGGVAALVVVLAVWFYLRGRRRARTEEARFTAARDDGATDGRPA